MAKDPAALFYIDKWLIATKEMKADCRGWFLNLVMHQYDKKDLPNDIEELANLADVRFSEYERFKQVFEQVLKNKFNINDRGRLENSFAKEIITSREQFKDKRSNSGKISYFSKFMRKFCKDENVIRFVITRTDFDNLDTKNEQVLKQVFEQTSKLYINENINENKDIYSLNNKGVPPVILDETDIEILADIDTTKLCLKILADFGFNQIRDDNKRREIEAALNYISFNKKLEWFEQQYYAYWEYKNKSKEQTHNLTPFFGQAKDQFVNAGWEAANWTEKLKNYNDGKSKSTNREDRQQSVDELTRAADAVLRGVQSQNGS